MTEKKPEELLRTGGAADLLRQLPTSSMENMVDRVLGDYRIKSLLGEGGMGRVYRAERTDGKFDRDVAIKISHASSLSSSLRARFLREQHILASINHANVASLFDAGTTEEGWPYIIMELVEGREIDDHVRSRQLSHRQTIGLILPILEALAFAHARLIVHRDIKSSNIVVTEDDEPRLLDFGIAKLLEGDDALLTEARPMTLSSASPEQILGQPITTASDIYQVGLLLHRLLLGRSALPERSLADVVSEAAAAKPFDLDPDSRARLPRDLGLIVARCLQADPTQRFRDINTLRDDLIRFLENRPVTVSAPTLRYRLLKLVQRNRAATLASILLMMTVIGGATLYTVQVTNARLVAENQAAISQEVINFLTEVFNVSDPGENRGSTVTARELLDKGAADLEAEFHDRPLIRAELQIVIAGVYRKLGLYNEALPLYESSRELRLAELGADHRDTLIAGNDLGIIYELLDRFEAAEQLYLQILERQRAALGSNDVDTMKTMQNLGSLYHKLGNFEQAAIFWEEALARRREVLGTAHPEFAATLSNLPIAYIGLGQMERAQELFLESLEVKRQVLGSDHPGTIGALANVGAMYFDRAMFSDARPYMEESWEVSRRVQGDSHPVTQIIGINLVSLYLEARDSIDDIDPLASAQEILDRIIPVARRELGSDHQNTIGAVVQRANLENARGNHLAALEALNDVLAAQIPKYGPANRSVLVTQVEIAKTYSLLGRHGDAVQYFEDILELQAAEIGHDHPDRLDTLLALGDAHLAGGNHQQAEALYRESLDAFEEQLGPDDPQTVRAAAYLEKLAAPSQ